MTRHTRSIEKSREAAFRRQIEGPFRLPDWARAHPEAARLDADSVDAWLDHFQADEYACSVSHDADHAVALERNQIVNWLNTDASLECGNFHQAILDGAHWEAGR